VSRRALIFAGLLVLAGCSSGGSHQTTAPPTSHGPPATAATTTTTAATTTIAPTAMPTTTVTSRGGPCSGAAPRQYIHVVWILMENRASSQVEGSSSAPYLDGLGTECAVATNYTGISHPSLPNYIALTSGTTAGITDDESPSAHPLSIPNIFSLLGSNWRALEESMPSNCDLSSGGEYAVRHNPAAYYTNIRAACASQDVPLRSLPDLSARFTFITPNVCDDMHDCPTQAGDAWLAREVPLILASPQYRAGNTAVFITFDENDAGGSAVPMYVVAPSIRPGTTVGQAFNHFSLLRTSEELLGLHPLLGQAATAPSMIAAFHL
jgi:hypothetical protein